MSPLLICWACERIQGDLKELRCGMCKMKRDSSWLLRWERDEEVLIHGEWKRMSRIVDEPLMVGQRVVGLRKWNGERGMWELRGVEEFRNKY